MSNYNHLVINKNRGWRGLAEAKAIDLDTKEELKMIFSFSQAIWDDMINKHVIVMQDENDYHVVYFEDDVYRLPRPTQQRSVLIKNFNAHILKVNSYPKNTWTSIKGDDWSTIRHFVKNKNNHTTSDWNCIGIRVIPEI